MHWGVGWRPQAGASGTDPASLEVLGFWLGFAGGSLVEQLGLACARRVGMQSPSSCNSDSTFRGSHPPFL